MLIELFCISRGVHYYYIMETIKLINKLCSLSRKMYTLTVFWKDAAVYLFITKLFGIDDAKGFYGDMQGTQSIFGIDTYI